MEVNHTLYIQTISDLEMAIKTHYRWTLTDKIVYAVDINHKCSQPLEFEVVKLNQHPVLRLILFNFMSYYAVKKLDKVVNESVPEAKILFRCPLCHEGYGSLWYPIYKGKQNIYIYNLII